ncbi:zinc finger Y-chromosomal protein-like [Epargyreus clarus]|uniref:zinc finger Y-chromosomal protein-like n=1 Tax=Epargyreus clarus TaxID=520877 RepID=UPI003C2FDE11
MSSDNKTLVQCRVCLNNIMTEYLSIFDKYKEYSIKYYILMITNIEMEEEDGFPDQICSSCLLELEAAVNFSEKCKNSDILLKKSKRTIIELCPETHIDVKNIIIKKEELEEIKVEGSADDGVEFNDDIEPIEQISVENIKPFKSKAIDLKFECHDCGNLFKSKCKLRVHWKKTHMLSSLICDICKRRFKSYKAFHMHKKNKLKSCKMAASKLIRVEGEGKSRVFHCIECKYKTKRTKDIQSHIVIHNGDRPYLCKLCPNRYTQQSSLQAHMECTHKKYLIEVTCHFCGKLVKGRSKVYRHLKTHTEAKRPCTVCNKMFAKKGLKQHMQRHSGIKSYTCEVCASTFYSLSELCNHRRWVHNKRKDAFKCDLCNYTASRKERITIHRKNHTDSNHPCTVCGMFFTELPKLEVHQKCHFEEKKFECAYCDMKFYRRESVAKHVKSKHKFILQVVPEITPVKLKEEEIETDNLLVKVIKKNKKNE